MGHMWGSADTEARAASDAVDYEERVSRHRAEKAAEEARPQQRRSPIQRIRRWLRRG